MSRTVNPSTQTGDIEALIVPRVTFTLLCGRCGAPMRDARYAHVEYALEDSAPEGQAYVRVAYQRDVPLGERRRWRAPSRPTAADAKMLLSLPQRHRLMCERDHGPWPVRDDSLIRQMVRQHRLGVTKVWIPFAN